MKKRILTLLLAVVMVVSVVALVACGENKNEKAAYGLVHGKGYVGKATVRVVEGKLEKAELDEACFPSYIVASAATADTVTATVLDHGAEVSKIFYKTVKWSNVTCEYDVAKGYLVEGKTLVEYFAEEANCQKYFEAVDANEVSVMIGGKADKTIMTAALLLKSQNGYWNNASGRGWGTNAVLTCNYVMKNGFKATSFVKDGTFTDNNGVAVTGVTWTDLADYYNLLKAAFNK